jgi:hypothetical protein
MVDPAALAVGGDHDALALRVGRHQLAIVPAGDDAVGIGGRGQDGGAVHRHRARFARRRHE